ncbi:sensor histidine kinase [Paenibacillus sp. N4]|uniref:sensor histidine kinase n=1 Tax=Paenibacillus vietnamensis TaxID=2590547 RepID=UPI001CD047D8|nr:sensor histidine kinase [Paenibacillus vietnamensis]MCA0757840.1 sensor histidine kinase [Paenibacillus vietnamensis]
MIFKWRERLCFWKYRFSAKLILVYFVLTVIPMSLLGVLSYWQYTKSIEEQIGEYMPRFLSQANSSINMHMREFTEFPSLMFNSDSMMAILRRDAYQNQSALNKDQYAVNSYLARTYLNTGNPDVLGVFILSKNRLFSSTRVKYSGLYAEDSTLPYGQNLDLRGEVRIILPSEINLSFETKEPFLLIMQQINDADNRRSLATMLVAVKLNFIDGILREFESNNKADLWLMNGEGEIIYHTNQELIGKRDNSITKYPVWNGSFRKGKGAGTIIYSLSQDDAYNWILVHSIPLRYLTERTDFVRNVTIVVFVCFVLITSVISIVFALRVTRPIKTLSKLMKDVEMGKLQVDLRLRSEDEIGMLARSFNSMVATIRELIENNFDIKIRQKEAELYALQSQINPHFLYNTLETINMAVEEGRSNMVVNMVTLLGKMLRFSVGNKSKFVSITDEVRHAGNYLTIQQFRFKDRLTFEIVIKTDIERLYTPKFILQPIVENAVKYGLESRKALDIRIGVTREFGARSGREDIVFRIRDNGPGIDHDRLKQMEDSFHSESVIHKDSGFGLSNVNARIAIMLGEEYGIQLHSIDGIGTEVTIRIPAIGPGEMK